MAKSIVKLVAIILAIFLICYVAIFGLEIGRDFYRPGVLSDRGIVQGLDLRGGSVIVFEADTESPTYDQMVSAESVLRARLDNMGYFEAIVERQGSAQIRVEIPDMANPGEAADMLGSVGELTFVGGDGVPIMTGAYIQSAEVRNAPVDHTGRSQIHIGVSTTSDGQSIWASETARVFQLPDETNPNFVEMAAQNLGMLPEEIIAHQPVNWRSVAIMLDGDLISAPVLQGALTERDFIITGGGPGGFEPDVARNLAGVINAGRLDIPLVQVELRQVSATLGDRALNASVLAGLIGLLLIMLFMILVYRLPGFVASMALLTFVGIMGIILANFRINLTLPGIAGILLAIGMANDAEILIFERIREEIRLGKTIRASVDTGFRRALTAIFDGEITSFIIAGILFWLGSGPVRGFGLTLMIGIAVSLFTAVVVTKLILNQMVGLNLKQPWLYGVRSEKSSEGGDA